MNSYSIYDLNAENDTNRSAYIKYLVLLPILSTSNKNNSIYIGWFPCNINKIGQVWWDHACTCDKTSQGDEIIPVLVTK